MSPALETMMLAFHDEGGLAPPASCLFMGAEPHPHLKNWPEIVGWQPFKPLAAAWEREGFRRIDELGEEKWPVVLLLAGKAKDDVLASFARAKARLAAGGTLVVSMPNTAGAGRFEKELARATGEVTSIQKHKCRAFYATDNGGWDEGLFQEWHALGDYKEVSGYMVQAGVFSSDHIDPGSQLLADQIPAHFHGHVADLGAGWGYLSAVLLKRCPHLKKLDLFEADARALECARRNLASFDKDIYFHWHDVTTGLPDRYDAIIMNPPFHKGQATDVDLGRAFLKVAAASLKRGGKLLLVANRQLPYEAALEASGLAWRKVTENKIYKVISADKR